ncbi:MAG: UDP-3-O-(3-hydroxymyristoyl)glucosamine N-acyltransferase, partial [Deltaproteobacteria bacterium]|nr:UDP-3-O-(3-hydroxymyristoyl)glucosamine N-acyltransferase [Deltaproteobacteria bacterium]
MIKKLIELAQLVNGNAAGDEKLEITGVADLESAGAGDITFLTNARQTAALTATKASAAVVPLAVQDAPLAIIRVQDPYLAIAQIHNFFVYQPFSATGVHPT